MRRPRRIRATIALAATAALVALPCALPGEVAAAKHTGVRAHASQSKSEVRRLQHSLGLSADGVFGPQTLRAVKRYQRRHGMTADGIVGPATRQALGLEPGPVLKRGRAHRRVHRASRRASARRSHRGSGVRAVQQALGLPADGVFGPGTQRAVKRFQRRRGLTADGVVGPATRHALGLGSGPMLKRRSHGRRGNGGGGGGGGTLERLVSAANRIASMPYRYGGGHRGFRDSGYDCSGSVSFALHGAGLLASPLDSSDFMSYGAPGRGRHITIYANPGHAYMVVDGRRFDTSAISETGSRWTSTHRSPSGYTLRHPPGF